MKAMTDRRYPKCSELGVLRKTKQGLVCISTSALHAALGWGKYQEFLPYMQHKSTSYGNNNGYVTPDSCERFLQGLDGK